MGYLWVGLGGGLGAIARFGLSRLAVARFGVAPPLATLAVNVTGSLLVGLLLSVLVDRGAPERWRLLTVVGFLGGYTTFSAYAIEAVAMVERGQGGRALAYVLGSNALALLACAAGIALARLLR